MAALGPEASRQAKPVRDAVTQSLDAILDAFTRWPPPANHGAKTQASDRDVRRNGRRHGAGARSQRAEAFRRDPGDGGAGAAGCPHRTADERPSNSDELAWRAVSAPALDWGNPGGTALPLGGGGDDRPRRPAGWAVGTGDRRDSPAFSLMPRVTKSTWQLAVPHLPEAQDQLMTS